jgi:hypothetical protein
MLGRRHGRVKLTGFALSNDIPLGFDTGSDLCRVEMWRGGLGAAYLLPALSSAGASFLQCARHLMGIVDVVDKNANWDLSP